MLLYNNDGTVSSILAAPGPDGKMTSSAEVIQNVNTASSYGTANSDNFASKSHTTLSNVTPTPAAFGAISANAAFEAKYPKTTAANFAYNLTTPLYEIVPSDTVFNPNFAFNNMRLTTDAFPGGGTGAVTFDGISQYFTAVNSEVKNWLPGTGDFTIEFFVKSGTQLVGAPRIFSLGFDTGATIGISYEGGSIYVWPYGEDLVGSTPANFNNRSAWMHVAICRSGTTTKLFLNGVLKATKLLDDRNINDSINPGFDLNVGVDNPSAGFPNWFAGKLTNFRWDNSAIYTGSSLTVPTAPLTKTATTKLLMLGGGASNPVYDASKLNHLVNHGSVWNSETPF